MVFDRTENEPEEWDPEEELYDPDSDGLTIPQVTTEDDPDEATSGIDVPSVSTDETDVPSDVLQAFWALVLVINAALFVVSLGALLLVFEGDVTRGGTLVGSGIVLFGLAGRRYRTFRADSDDEPADSNPGDEDRSADDATETTSGDGTQA
ncbi:hypothetical protein E2L06_04875 [Haloterrigena sp. H1]|uniref:DUF7322 domain-containing protein n=1 Tax=Haloterrigena sp. H1 TaxID=2552943 RepID=UPI00110E4754|nr:hypothetical protein [Haloterrigena sp. H1]TMT85960.1 hypothetical protein E2L06_04875 [Haloterrigena sp. H1]